MRYFYIWKLCSKPASLLCAISKFERFVQPVFRAPFLNLKALIEINQSFMHLSKFKRFVQTVFRALFLNERYVRK